ncbi:MAG: PspC domain-containing protein [Propionibacteriaceae bacterium]|nr:PspC domain-containing protein [Propionibacteriaceae bacterium]
MGTPYPSYQPPRKLERSRTNKVVGGVCGGLANYLNMDPTLVRVLTVVVSLFTGVPVILYLIALFVIPEEGSSSGPQSYPPVTAPGDYGTYPTTYAGEYGQANQPSYAPSPSPQTGPTPPYGGSEAPAGADDAVWGTEGAPWEQRQPEPVAESTAAPEAEQVPSPEQTSAWESAPAEPSTKPEEDKRT